MRNIRLPCGCQYEAGERERWMALCDVHQREQDELHGRAAREHECDPWDDPVRSDQRALAREHNRTVGR